MAIKDITAVEGGEPWAEYPFYQGDRLLIVSIRWSADDGVVEDIMRLAEKRDLFIYDPQGPDVYPPGEPIGPRLTLGQQLKSVLMVVPFAVATYAAWLIPWGWLRWPLVAVGLFFTAAALFALWAVIASSAGWLDEKEPG